MFEITVSTFLRYLKENLLNVKKHQSIRKEKKRKSPKNEENYTHIQRVRKKAIITERNQ